jgi:hypothetical protein
VVDPKFLTSGWRIFSRANLVVIGFSLAIWSRLRDLVLLADMPIFWSPC